MILIGSAAGLFLIWPWIVKPGVRFSVQRKGEGVEFTVAPKNAYGLDEFILYDRASKEVLWSVLLSYYPKTTFAYGAPVPPAHFAGGGVVKALQGVPESDTAPRRLPVGREILVAIGYQHRDMFDEVSSTTYFAFMLDPDGGVRCWPTEAQDFFLRK